MKDRPHSKNTSQDNQIKKEDVDGEHSYDLQPIDDEDSFAGNLDSDDERSYDYADNVDEDGYEESAFSKEKNNDDKKHGDSLERWSKQSDINVYVWNYYNNVVSEKIISEGMYKNDISLRNLYRQLALVRAECEWMKEYLRKNERSISAKTLAEKIEYIAKNNFFHAFPEDFANFQSGGTGEANILGNWGNTISEFAKKRLPLSDKSRVGLSTVYQSRGKDDSYDVTLKHPKNYVLQKLEPDFQYLLHATNFFEYLQSASRIMYILSNFPPVSRGSAAVNSWLIDKIAKEKFGISASLRPALFDWTAFFETPEQYTNFYVISAAVAYIKDIKKIHGINEFEVKLYARMMENPNIIDNLNERENLWNELKAIIQNSISNPELDEMEKRRLNEIISGKLVFTYPSEKVQRIEKIISVENNLSESLESLSTTEKEYLDKLLAFEKNPQAFIFNQKIEDKEMINALWADCEFLFTRLNSKVISHLYSLKSEKINLENDSKQKTEYVNANQICKWGFIDTENLHEYSELLNFSHGLENQIAFALKNGIDLNKINDCVVHHGWGRRELEIFTSRSMILCHKVNPDLAVTDFISSSSMETEMNILRFVAQEYCRGENLETIQDDKIRNCLLIYLDPCLLQKNNLSELTGQTEIETMEKILSAYLDYYNLSDMQIENNYKSMTEALELICQHNANDIYSLRGKLEELINPEELNIGKKTSVRASSSFFQQSETDLSTDKAPDSSQHGRTSKR